MKAVYTADNPMQAYVVKNFLEGEGIPAVVLGEVMFALLGVGGPFNDEDSLPQVCVTNDEDVPRALELLRARRAPPNSHPHPSPLPAGEGRDEAGPAAPEELTPQAGRLWVRCALLFVLCCIAASILLGLWSLLSLWLRKAPW